MIPADGLTNDSVQEPGTTPSASFYVTGIPVQQGSKNAYVVGKRAVVTDQNAKTLKPWRATVAEQAGVAARECEQFAGALAVALDFYMPRGATVKRARPSVTPDLDKLVRALFDGITDSKLWKDDALVVEMNVREWYADDRPPGVQVRIDGLTA